jgi:hypothetical protein
MNWTNALARGQQLNHNHRPHSGCAPDRPLARGEVLELGSGGEAYPERAAAAAEGDSPAKSEHRAYQLRVIVEHARRAVAEIERGEAHGPEHDLALAEAERQGFWVDTCREVMRMRLASPEVLDLYRRQGCRFYELTHQQAQVILDALDSAMPFWDRDQPELFYQTIELNFPELLRRAA